VTGPAIAGLFLTAGMAAGAAQAGLLARAARRPHGARAAFAPLLRYLAVGAVLFAAARAGHLGAATAGWVAGLLAGGALQLRRLP